MTDTVHAGAVLLGADGVLIRGPSGAGKSALALALIERRRARGLFAALVADDRAELSVHGGRLVARAPECLAGLCERRGRGILPLPHEPAAVIRLVVDLVEEEQLERLPDDDAFSVEIRGVRLPRQAVPRRTLALANPLVEDALAALREPSPAP